MTNGISDFLQSARELFHTGRARLASVLIDGNLMTMRLNRERAVEGGFHRRRDAAVCLVIASRVAMT